ncbi:hypothetical protein EGW08_004930 [Elysia chlorotica]|uniref:Fibrinogen C-terminal domain-containing protein n=1 Tax=Elysia chlorotica TaxID=188477 RepID=A0A3S1HW60_ELYCH|nr:hypothetical protein EGW08_004930 [Elysia chlorotica]
MMEFTTGVTKCSAVLLCANLLLIPAAMSVLTNTQGLELTMGRNLLANGAQGPCGQLTCRAKGNSHTLHSVAVIRVKADGQATELLELDLVNPGTNSSVSSSGVIGFGKLYGNIATINLDLMDPTVCDSSYFICEVTFEKESGERQRAFTTAGPGQVPSLYPGLPASEHPTDQPSDIRPAELQRLKEKVNKIEEKFESLSDMLDKKITLVFDTIRSVDTSSRVSRLEDRLLPFVLSRDSDDSNTDVLQALSGLEARLEEVNETVTNLRKFQPQDEQPQDCTRGMGDDVTKSYPSYAIMKHDMLQREILCETQKNGGGWIVIQRRVNGDVDFYRDWTSYRDGFGSLTGDFWIGNEAIHQLTNSAAFELRVDIRFKDEEQFAEYGLFRIEEEANKYRLHVDQYSGTAGDGLTYSNSHYFSTFEADHDVHGPNCAVDFHGAWWYKSCADANLNGRWGVPASEGAYWVWVANKDPVSYSEMKIRRPPPPPRFLNAHFSFYACLSLLALKILSSFLISLHALKIFKFFFLISLLALKILSSFF